MPEKVKLAFLWHMHQPYYKDPLTSQFEMPWVRLHGLKDYWGMAALLREFPRARVTFNLAPSLVAQIQDLLTNPDSDPLFHLVFLPETALTPDQKAFLCETLFQANYENLITRFPRLVELYQKTHAIPDAPAQWKAQQLGDQDFMDLQVLSQLCWFDEIYLESDPVIHSLQERGRMFGEEDKREVRAKELELLSRILPTYRELAEQGQIEISASPFYHPILPLLCDSNIALQCQPRLPLPNVSYRHPEDAQLQVTRALEQQERVFGRRPAGMWPSEGAVSNAALSILAEAGLRWAATDEEILSRSLNIEFHRNEAGEIAHADSLHSPYQFRNTPLYLFFRDHELSDALGFVYSRMSTREAVEDFVRRIKSSVSPTEARPCVSIILDGENPWESYPRNGRPFLKLLYQTLTEDPQIEMATFSDMAASFGPNTRRLDSIWPGSWINADYSVWIGHTEDNRAWELLKEARDAFTAIQEKNPDGGDSLEMKAARESLLIAEGSDWCWWYGPQHSTVNDLQFDRLFRAHLMHCFQKLGYPVPAYLAEPLKRHGRKRVQLPPLGRIHPEIDGRVTNYFEWMGAGSVEETGTTMHQSRKYFETFYYGWDDEHLFVRLDPSKAGLQKDETLDVKVFSQSPLSVILKNVFGGTAAIRAVSRENSTGVEKEMSPDEAAAECRQLLEARIRRSVWPLPLEAQLPFYVVLEVNGVPVDRIPAQGFLMIDDRLLE